MSVRACGDATAEVFPISAAVGLVTLIAVLFIKERPLRRTVDIQPAERASPGSGADASQRESPTPELASVSG